MPFIHIADAVINLQEVLCAWLEEWTDGPVLKVRFSGLDKEVELFLKDMTYAQARGALSEKWPDVFYEEESE